MLAHNDLVVLKLILQITLLPQHMHNFQDSSIEAKRQHSKCRVRSEDPHAKWWPGILILGKRPRLIELAKPSDVVIDDTLDGPGVRRIPSATTEILRFLRLL